MGLLKLERVSEPSQKEGDEYVNVDFTIRIYEYK